MTIKKFSLSSNLLLVALLIFGLSISFHSTLAAWVAPTATPPSGNIAGPVNVGSTLQSKSGALNVMGGFSVSVNDLFVDTSISKVGIGTNAPGAKLDVVGATGIRYSGVRKSYSNYSSGAAVEWIKLGTFTQAWGGGQTLVLRYSGGVGYNNNTNQMANAEISFRRSWDGSCTTQCLSGYYFNNGQSIPVMAVKSVQIGGNNSLTNDIYAQVNVYTGNGFWEATMDDGSGFTWALTAATDPGTGSNILAVPFSYAIANNALNIDSTGNVGIGTTNLGAKLEVGGNTIINASAVSWTEGLNIDSSDGIWGGVKWRTVGRSGNIGNWHLGYNATHNTEANSNLYLFNGAGNYPMTWTQAGNVGIGITNPTAKLQINPPTGNEGVRIISSNFSPLVIRNTANSADLFRVNETGVTTIGGKAVCLADGTNCTTGVGGIDISRIVYGSNQNKTSNLGALISPQSGSGFYESSTATDGPIGAGWTHYMINNHSNVSAGAGYQMILAQPYWEDNLYTRRVDADTKRPWRKILDSGNFNSYALPLAGGNITGGLTIGSKAICLADGTNCAAVTPTSWAGVTNKSLGVTAQGDLNLDIGVSQYMRWKNYGNSHVIIDASNSTAPNGSAINNTNAQVAWTGTYPTLMGWNGANTYGVRVDSARVADSATDATKMLKTGDTISGELDATGGTGTVYNTAPIEIRTTLTPRISFHWPGVVASQLGMDSAGVIRTYDNPGTGYANFAAASITSNGTITAGTGGITLGGVNKTAWPAASGVTSVFSRAGAVVAATGDYTTTQVTEGTNLYFTNARAQTAITGGASAITSANLTASRALVSDTSGKVGVSTVTGTQLGYLSGATSAIQTQLNAKAPSASPTFTGSVTMGTGGITLGGVNKTAWPAASGVTSVFSRAGAVVAATGDYTTTQVTEGTNLYFTNARAQTAITGGASAITSANLTASRALVSDTSGKVGVSTVTGTQLGYLSGATSDIQTQLNAKAPSASPTFTGTLTSGADIIVNGLTIGRGAGNSSSNTANGYAALYRNTIGTNNTANGMYTLLNNTIGNGNTANGYLALYNNTTGFSNTAIGFDALYGNTTGDYNTAIGVYADVSASGLTNATAIGANALVTASNKVRIGNTAVTRIEGQVGWSIGSDIRLKHDIVDSDLGLGFINKLRPVSYKLNNGDGGLNYGFIAQEVEAAAGKMTNIVMTDNSPEKMKTMRYTDLIAPMVKAMQEQQQEINKKQSVIDSLIKRIERLEAN